MGKKRPAAGLASIGKRLSVEVFGEDWGDNEWERWRKAMYPDAPNDLQTYLESLRKKKKLSEEETSERLETGAGLIWRGLPPASRNSV